MVDPITKTICDLMKRFGGDAKLVVEGGESTYDPSTSSVVATSKQYTVRVLAEDYIQKASGLTSQAGGLIQTGDKRFFVKADGVPKPRVGVDYILFQGAKWSIHTMKDLNPSGTNSYLYEVYARQ